MLKAKGAIAVVMTCLLTAGSVHAGWHEFWDRFHLDAHRNNCWPEPFSSIDRRAAQAPFAAMVGSGWRTQNTLSQHYFDRETQQLNEAGERKLYWILSNAPEPYRTVFVAESYQSDESRKRIDSVQQTLARLLPTEPLPPVVATKLEPRGWPAEYIDTIDRKVQATVPDPRLPTFQAAGGSGGGN